MLDGGKIREISQELNEYKKIQPETAITKQDCQKFWNEKIKQEMASVEHKKMMAGLERGTLLPRNGGTWSGEVGNSKWIPDKAVIPGDRNGTNPEHKKWGQILEKYGIDSVEFKKGYPDFSEIARETVEIDDFTDDRSINFDQADEEMAEKRNCTPEEIAKWRAEQKYTWHECSDCRTMQLVPTEIHGNISHSGGISKYKSNSLTGEV